MGILATLGAFALYFSILLTAYSASSCSSYNYVTLSSESSTKTISSPNYPNNYPPYTTCKWLITAPLGYKVQLKFTGFDLYGSGSCDSLSDSLVVYNSSSSTSGLLGRLCGNTLPPTLISGWIYMYLEFSSRSFRSRKGFSITVSTANTAGCGSVAFGASTSTSRYITTPNYPNNYPSSTACQWNIKAPPGYVVQITFNSFNTDGSITGSCTSSTHNLNIYDSSYVLNSKLLGKYCGSNLPANVVSRQGNMLLTFSSDSYDSKSGFKITYKAVKDPAEDSSMCSPFNSDSTNNDITLKASSSSQYIQSPYYPNKYPSNIECTWIISASSSKKKIKLTVLDMNIYNYYSYSCSSGDSLTIRDGSSSYSSQLKQFCSKSYSSYTVTSSGQQVWIHFKTNADNYFNRATQAGFKIKFMDAEESSSNVGMIVGIIIGVLVFIGLIVCCVYVTQRRGSRGHVQSNAAATSVQATTTTTTYQPPPPAPAPHYPLQQVGPPPGGVYQPPGGGYPPQTGVYPPPAMTYLPPGGSYPQQPQGSYPPPAGGYPQYPASNTASIPPPQYQGSASAYPAQVNQAYSPQRQDVPPNPAPQGV